MIDRRLIGAAALLAVALAASPARAQNVIAAAQSIDGGFDARQQPLGVRGVLFTARARNWCDIYRNPSEIETRAPGAVRQILAAGGSCV